MVALTFPDGARREYPDRITGLEAAQFLPLYDLSEAELAARGVKRVTGAEAVIRCM